MSSLPPRAAGEELWILDDQPGPAQVVVDLCRSADVTPRVFRTAAAMLRALRGAAPSVVVLDWRLENELSAPLYLAVRHRLPALPVIYWTATTTATLPEMIRHDPMTRVVEKAAGMEVFEDALAWGLYATDGAAAGRALGNQPA